MNQSFDFESHPVVQEIERPATGSQIYNSPEIQQMGNTLGAACCTLSEEVPVGYKRTEVGVIPADWNVKRLGEIGLFSKGSGIKREDVSETGVPCIRYGELYTRYQNYIPEAVSRIPLNVAYQALPVTSGDLLFAGSGETTEEIGRCSAYVGAEQAYAGGDIIVFRPIGQNPIFFGHLMNFSTIAVQKARMGQGDAVVHISARNLAQIQVSLPPLSEQRTIAEALSDVDGMLTALEVLIAKKRAIKQAAMQQLLTGKTRLPGFSGMWETKRLGDIAHIKTGTRNNQDKVDGGLYPFFVRSVTIERINSYTFEGEAILVPGEGNIGGIFHYVSGRFDVHQRVYQISRFSTDVCGKFLYYSMVLYFGAHATQNTVKATVDSLRLPTFKNFTVSLPRDVAEQREIVEILSDMDVQIASLEQRRKKIRAVKQSMMQLLLTGRVRLLTCPTA